MHILYKRKSISQLNSQRSYTHHFLIGFLPRTLRFLNFSKLILSCSFIVSFWREILFDYVKSSLLFWRVLDFPKPLLGEPSYFFFIKGDVILSCPKVSLFCTILNSPSELELTSYSFYFLNSPSILAYEDF